MDLVELAPRVRPASRFDDGSIFIELPEAGVGIGLEGSLVELQVLLRVFALAVGRVGEPHGWRGLVARGPVVADIGPEPSGLGPAAPRIEHRNRGVVGVQGRSRADMIADRPGQGLEEEGQATHPLGQGRAIQIEAGAGEDLVVEQLLGSRQEDLADGRVRSERFPGG